MSTTQELIERLREAEQTLADYEREGKAGGWVMSADLARVTFDRLASLSAELDALKAKLAGVDEKALEVCAKAEHERAREFSMREHGFEIPAWAELEQIFRDSAISTARHHIAAYLAAVGQKP